MAGKAEKVPPIVDEFVDIHTGEKGGRTLLRADEIERQQEEQPREHRTRENLRYGDRGWV
jgi:hypothetical protein